MPGHLITRMAKEGRSFSAREKNCCFFNTGSAPKASGRFANISAVSGLDFPDDGRAVVPVDWDHDGDSDLWIANRNAPQLRLMRNDTSTTNHFVALKLIGNGTTVNRDAIGARVEVVLNEKKVEGREAKGEGRVAKGDTQQGKSDEREGTGNTKPDSPPSRIPHPVSSSRLIKTLRAGEGFLAQSGKWLHFGLGAANRIDIVTVRWPGGPTEEFHNLEVDRRHQIVQGTGEARLSEKETRQTKLEPSVPQLPPGSDSARIPLVTLLTLPQNTYMEFDGRQSLLPAQTGQPLLVNLWASWCSPCVAELSEFTRRQREIQAKGIQILALSVDGLGADSSSPEAAALTISQIGFPFAAGRASSQLVNFLQTTHDKLVVANRTLPLPTSFLIDARGRLAMIYKGTVSIDDLLEDVAHSERNRIERFARSSSIGGRTIAHPQMENTRINAETGIRFLLASRLQQARRFTEAAIQHREILEVRPDAAYAHNDLGYILQQQGRLDEALMHYIRAVQIRPKYAVAHYNLGNIRLNQGLLDDAAQEYRLALQTSPDFADAHYKLSYVLQQQGRYSEAKDHFERAKQIKPQLATASGRPKGE